MKVIEIDGKPVSVKLTVDAVGLFCPLPIVKLTSGLERIDPGEVIELLADDPGVEEDVRSWCSETGNELLSVRRDAEGVFLVYVRNGVRNGEA